MGLLQGTVGDGDEQGEPCARPTLCCLFCLLFFSHPPPSPVPSPEALFVRGTHQVEDAIAPEQVAVLRRRVLEQAEGERLAGIAQKTPSGQNINCCINKGQCFEGLIEQAPHVVQARRTITLFRTADRSRGPCKHGTGIGFDVAVANNALRQSCPFPVCDVLWCGAAPHVALSSHMVAHVVVQGGAVVDQLVTEALGSNYICTSLIAAISLQGGVPQALHQDQVLTTETLRPWTPPPEHQRCKRTGS